MVTGESVRVSGDREGVKVSGDRGGYEDEW